MNRRSFIGTTLGFLLGTKIPFVPEEPKPVQQFPTDLDLTKNIIAAFDSKHLMKWKIIALASNGERFYAPGFSKIIKNHRESKIEFHCHDIQIFNAIEIKGASLINELNVLIANYPLSVFGVNGDTLRIHFVLGCKIT